MTKYKWDKEITSGDNWNWLLKGNCCTDALHAIVYLEDDKWHVSMSFECYRSYHPRVSYRIEGYSTAQEAMEDIGGLFDV